jgi:cyclase
LVLGLDANWLDGQWIVYTHGGRTPTGRQAIDWAKEAEQRGAGEILLTSMRKDGTKSGFDIELTKVISGATNIPIIASGGAGKIEDFAEIFHIADAALAASIFHFGEIPIPELKQTLRTQKIAIR